MLPIYAATSPYNIADANNALAASYLIPLFLCPSDKAQSLGGGYGVASLGSANYCANMGSGLNYAEWKRPPMDRPTMPDGVMYAKIPASGWPTLRMGRAIRRRCPKVPG